MHLCCSAPSFICTLYILKSQQLIVSMVHSFETASKSTIFSSKNSSSFKRNASPSATLNGIGLLVEMLAGYIVKKAGLILTMAYYLSHIKTISMSSINCVLPSWHFRAALYIYISRKLCFLWPTSKSPYSFPKTEEF